MLFFRVLVRSAHNERWLKPSVSGHDISETELSQLRVELADALVLGSSSAGLLLLLLEGVEGSRLGLSLLLETSDGIGLSPAGEGGEITERHELTLGLQAESAESVWHDHALLLVVREGHALEDLKLAKSGGASRQLVREHTTDTLPEDARGGSPVLLTTAGVGVNTLVHHILTDDLVPLDPAGLEDLLTAHNGDALTGQEFFGNNAGETALEVASSVNDQLLFEHA